MGHSKDLNRMKPYLFVVLLKIFWSKIFGSMPSFQLEKAKALHIISVTFGHNPQRWVRRWGCLQEIPAFISETYVLYD